MFLFRSFVFRLSIVLILLFGVTLLSGYYTFFSSAEENTEIVNPYEEQQKFLQEIETLSAPKDNSLQAAGSNINLSYVLGLMTQMSSHDARFLLGESASSSSTLDINGDGLTDILHHRRLSQQNNTSGFYLEVNLNIGNNLFNSHYNCQSGAAGLMGMGWWDVWDGCMQSPRIYKYGTSDYWNKWPKSSQLKSGEYYRLLLMLASGGAKYNYNGLSSYESPRMYTMMDINGDGLIDFLQHYYSHSYYSNSLSIDNVKFYIFLNKGDMNFEEIYACEGTRELRGSNTPIFTYYGDCAL